MKLQFPSRKISASRFHNSGVRRPTEPRMHFMPADAVDLDESAVDEYLAAADFDLAESERLLNDFLASGGILQSDHKLVQVRMLIVPFRWARYGDTHRFIPGRSGTKPFHSTATGTAFTAEESARGRT